MATRGEKLIIGPRLKTLRQSLGLTQEQMAAELDVSASYITLIEANQRPASAKLLMRLAAVYDLNVSELSPSGDAQLASDLAASLKDPVMEAQISRTEIEQAMRSAPAKLNIGLNHNVFSDPRLIYFSRLNMDQTPRISASTVICSSDSIASRAQA